MSVTKLYNVVYTTKFPNMVAPKLKLQHDQRWQNNGKRLAMQSQRDHFAKSGEAGVMVCHNKLSIKKMRGITVVPWSQRHGVVTAAQYCKTIKKKLLTLVQDDGTCVVQLNPTSKAIMTIKPATVVHDAS